MSDILKNRKLRFFIALFSLLLLFDMIQGSYAKYVSSAEAGTNLTIAKWAFKVNGQDIIDNNNFTDTIVPVFEGSSYVAPGVIAPGSEGYFDIEIDSSNTDVNFNQTITLALADENTVTGYKMNNGNFIEFDEDTVITSHITQNSINKINIYRVYVKWVDDEGETMNNTDDTNASKNGVASIAITTNFIQTIN